MGIMGLPSNSRLMRLISKIGRDCRSLPPEGLVLSKKLGAKCFTSKPGDTLRVETLQDKRPIVDVPVVALIDDICRPQRVHGH